MEHLISHFARDQSMDAVRNSRYGRSDGCGFQKSARGIGLVLSEKPRFVEGKVSEAARRSEAGAGKPSCRGDQESRAVEESKAQQAAAEQAALQQREIEALREQVRELAAGSKKSRLAN